MDKITSFADRIATYRSVNYLTLATLGERLNIPPQTLNRYELGQRVPKISTVTDIADKLGVNPLWLQGYDAPYKLEDYSSMNDMNQYLEALSEREELRALFNVSKNASKADIERTIAIINALRKVEY